jgi:hypothetical protein
MRREEMAGSVAPAARGIVRTRLRSGVVRVVAQVRCEPGLHFGEGRTLAAGVLHDLVAAQPSHVEVTGGGVCEVQAAHARCRRLGAALRRVDPELFGAEQLEERALLRVLAVAPRSARLGMQALGKGLPGVRIAIPRNTSRPTGELVLPARLACQALAAPAGPTDAAGGSAPPRARSRPDRRSGAPPHDAGRSA